MKTLLGIIAMTLAISGWFVSHGEDIYWVKRLLAPQYIVALETYENMIKNKSSVKEGEPGFNQLADILSEDLSGPGDLTISEIRIIGHAISFKSYDTGMKTYQLFQLKLLYEMAGKLKLQVWMIYVRN